MKVLYIGHYKDGDTAIKQWKPTYVLDDGTRIKYTHQMFHLL